MFVLKAGPDLPDHVLIHADGIPYADDASRSNESLPRRFDGPARPEDPEGPPWSTLVFGLETGRHGLRDRFLEALRIDAEAARPLVRYGDALESAFREIFGGRGATDDGPGFLAFVNQALMQAVHPGEREQLARGKRELVARPLDERICTTGATAVAFGTETGHWPADHPEVMYWLSALVPGWNGVHFDQSVGDGDEEAESFILSAWCGGQTVRAPARNLGDYVDVWSCAGLVNVVLRDVVRSNIRVCIECEDEGAVAVAGTPETLEKLRAEGVLKSHDEYDE